MKLFSVAVTGTMPDGKQVVKAIGLRANMVEEAHEAIQDHMSQLYPGIRNVVIADSAAINEAWYTLVQ